MNCWNAITRPRRAPFTTSTSVRRVTRSMAESIIQSPEDFRVFDDLARTIEQASEIASPLAGKAIDNSLRAIYAATEAYPAETAANSPQNPSGRWYFELSHCWIHTRRH